MTNLNMREPSRISRENGGLAALRGWAGSRIGLLTIAGAAIVGGSRSTGAGWSRPASPL